MKQAEVEERLVFFPCGKNSLAGVVTIPREPNGQTVLIPWGSGAFPSSGPNRIRARLARALAEQGFHAFRFDYRGVGESDGDYQKPDMEKPNTEEITAAFAWLTSQGFFEIVIVANCFGAWSALMATPMLQGLRGLAMVNAPVGRDHKQVEASEGSLRWWVGKARGLSWAKLRNANRRSVYRKMVVAKATSVVGRSRDGRFSRAICEVLDRGIPILLVYGNDDFRFDLESELERGLSNELAKASPLTRVAITSERLEGFASFAAQDALLTEIIPWVKELSKSSK